ncbi:unnamed protein product [Ilex paraguariensis]|uniref:GINS subunit domain-containing protein n=1 Tax=Ilex paraguariensis TaxID=185542 RepID=A0ABC8UQ01_9AQUA
MAQYFDIDDILAEDELVPAVFKEAANGVGIFDSSDDTNRVEAGSKAELPFWLASELHLRQAVSINVPLVSIKSKLLIISDDFLMCCFSSVYMVFLNVRTREEIEADAAHVDLRKRCPYFYELGCKLAHLIDDRILSDKNIGPVLFVAFQTRYKDVLVKAHTSALSVTAKNLTLLTREETKLYETAQSSTAAFKKWKMGGPRFQKAYVLGRKRKPTE